MENNCGRNRKASDAAPGTDLTASGSDETNGSPTVLVALANPRTESALVTLAGVLAKQRGGTVLAIHVVSVPDQTALEAAVENERIGAESERLLEAARRTPNRPSSKSIREPSCHTGGSRKFLTLPGEPVLRPF
ncbi:MAG: hypothetical protein V5A36_00190 [Natronomonas sp.]